MIFQSVDRARKSSAKSPTPYTICTPGSTGQVLKCLIPPGVTGKDRQRPARHRKQPGRHRKQPGRHRSSTGAHTDPGRATATPR
ncbi:hypothetical protein DPMN_136073 [Dreissena polymorpha]|uniref:Uncharacterized protein n=1 Tax=Dreissena polymorpha TaxID=45954 RepID=A0A9D4JCB0_DREPO|nr:hypothetical protein DPMN_136073 [Dreissena polymorpha]